VRGIAGADFVAASGFAGSAAGGVAGSGAFAAGGALGSAGGWLSSGLGVEEHALRIIDIIVTRITFRMEFPFTGVCALKVINSRSEVQSDIRGKPVHAMYWSGVRLHLD
jgi:hypothetical protein